MNNMNLVPACIPWSVVMILLLIAVPQNSTANPEIEITWQDIVKLVDDHPRIGAGRHEIAAAHAAVEAARAAPNPGVEATAAYGQATDNSASRVITATLLTLFVLPSLYLLFAPEIAVETSD